MTTKNDIMGCKQDHIVVFCNDNVRTATGAEHRMKREETAGLEIIKILTIQYQMQWAY